MDKELINEPAILLVEEEKEEEEALVEYDIATYPSDYTLKGLFDKWNTKPKEIIIPDFQRGFVWSIEQSSKLIESFLLGLPVPPVFFYIDNDNLNQVIDGQQRLLSVFFFFEGYFGFQNEKGKRKVFKLEGLNGKSPYYEKTFDKLEDDQKRKLQGSVLRAINIRQLSPRGDFTCIYHIFERLNTGGTVLTSQEIRNVVYRGNFMEQLKTLNKNTNWRSILGKKILDKHQKDIELVLKAFSLCYHLDEYEKPMYNFLNDIAGRYKDSTSGNVDKFSKDFIKATKLIDDILPIKPFNVRGPLNSSAFDSIFCSIVNNINKIPNDLCDRYNKMIKEHSFIDYTSLGTTDTNTVKNRYNYVKKYLID